MKNLLLAGLIGIWATTATAHSPLTNTEPKDAATIVEAPSEVVLEFKGDIRLTRVTLTHADHAGVDLDLSGNTGFKSAYVVPLPSTGRGLFVIHWRGLGADGHAMNGTFSFTVK